MKQAAPLFFFSFLFFSFPSFNERTRDYGKLIEKEEGVKSGEGFINRVLLIKERAALN